MRLVQLSDTHIVPQNRQPIHRHDTLERLGGAIDAVNELKPLPSFSISPRPKILHFKPFPAAILRATAASIWGGIPFPGALDRSRAVIVPSAVI